MKPLPPTLILAAGLALSGCGETTSSAEDASAELDAVLDDLLAHTLEIDVGARMERGLLVSELPLFVPGFGLPAPAALRLEDAVAEAELQQETLSRLQAVDRDALDLSDQLTLDAVLWETSMAIEGLEHFWLQGFLTPYASPLRMLGGVYPLMPLGSETEARAYLDLVGQLPGYIAAVEERARGQAERGIAVARSSLDGTLATWRAQIVPAEKSMLWPSDARVGDLEETTVLTFRASLAQLLEEQVNPAYESLVAFLEGPYAGVAPPGVGLSQYPGGQAYYEYLTRLHTTLAVSPEQVQEAGRELLAEFARAMSQIRRELGFEGTREEFHAMLRTDPRYFPEDPDEVASRLQEAADRMWARIDQYFQVTQQAEYGVRRLRADLEPTMTYGYYNPPSPADPVGYYNYNGSSLDQRSWIGLAAIGLHELIPGHHFHVARQMENTALHELRRNRRHTAFTEGWGSYASFLGLEADIFQDPYERYGLYVLESFLATRLVVDPGMNYFDMSLDEARQFMRENTLESETQIATESLRYSTDIPGQALGYQMGKRAFLDLRSQAEQALGDGFDLPAFHEAVIENGSLPMVVLQERIDRFVAESGPGDPGP